MGRGRVKRRSPPSIEQFAVVMRDAALRRLRIINSKSNRITSFRQSSDFSHGLGGNPTPLAAAHRIGPQEAREDAAPDPEASLIGERASNRARLVFTNSPSAAEPEPDK